MAGHYYLLSSLPEFNPLEGNPKIHFGELYEFIIDNITVDERKEIKYLVFRNDVRNFLSQRARKWGFDEFSLPFITPSLFDEEYWDDPVISWEILPDFMERFIEYRECKSLSEFNIFQSRVWISYYESSIERANKYLKKVLSLELFLYSSIHDFLTKRQGFVDQRIEANFFNEREEPNEEYLSFLRELFSGSQNMLNLERHADELIIKAANNIIPMNRFRFNSITAYTYRLLIGAKWNSLSEEEGEKRKLNMINKMTEEFPLPV